MKRLALVMLLSSLFVTVNAQSKMKTIYDFKVKTIDGKEFDMASLKGKKVIIVNTASECGNTPQYAELEKLYEMYKAKNVVIIGFPANNFGGQEPGSDTEIQQFCSKKYAVTFPMMSKISTKGNDQAPLYKWLTQKSENGVQDAPVTWNFQKFLINEKGQWVAMVAPGTKPMASKELMDFIAK